MKKIWKILQKLQSPVSDRNKACLANLKEAQASFTDFHAYTMYTARIVMEETLYFYRSNLSETQLKFLGDSSLSALAGDVEADGELLREASILIAGGTPKSHRRMRCTPKGHGWLVQQLHLKVQILQYQAKFLRPIKAICSAAAAVQDQKRGWNFVKLNGVGRGGFRYPRAWSWH